MNFDPCYGVAVIDCANNECMLFNGLCNILLLILHVFTFHFIARLNLCVCAGLLTSEPDTALAVFRRNFQRLVRGFIYHLVL